MKTTAILVSLAVLGAGAVGAAERATDAGSVRHAYFRVESPDARRQIAPFASHELPGGIVGAAASPATLDALAATPGLTLLGFESVFRPAPIVADQKVEAGAVRTPAAAGDGRYCQLPSWIPQVNWGIKAMYEDPNLVRPSGGDGVRVAVIDGGVSPHLDVVRRVVKCVNLTPVSDSLSCDDVIVHGTMVASIIAADGGADGLGMYGMAPGASIYSYKVCEPNEECWGAYIAAGVYAAIADSVNIINMSLSGSGHDEVVQAAIDTAVAHNILVVVAAGNSPPFSHVGWPAVYPEVMSVGAIAENRDPWLYSASGLNDGDYLRETNEVEVAAPGSAVLGAMWNGCYVLGHGTSLAAPHVTGLAAKLWNGDAAETRKRLQFSARLHDLYAAGDDTLTGFGLPTATPIPTILSTADLGGKVTPSGPVLVAPGGAQSFTITPLAGCGSIQDVEVDGVSRGPLSSYSFTDVRSDHSIHARFSTTGPFSITASAGSGGTISPSGVSGVPCGGSRTYTITPATECMGIQDVKVDGVSRGRVTSYTFSDVAASHTIQATFVALGPYAIQGSVGTDGGTISPTGVTSVACGGSQSYTITPGYCRSIAGVRVDGNAKGALSSYTFTNVRANHTIQATFSPPSVFIISASAGAGGTITPSGGSVVTCQTSKTYAIAPGPCRRIEDVKVDGVSQGPITSYTFVNVIANHTITAQFSATSPVLITASAGPGGTISPSGPTGVACGGSQTYAIAPGTGCVGTYDVKVDGVSRGPITSYTFTNVTSDHSIAVTFALGPFTITASAGSGTISPSGTSSVACGDSLTYTIGPSGNCPGTLDVRVDGVSKGAVTSYTFRDVRANHTISATYSAGPFTITASAGPSGAISPTGVSSLACGASQTYTITASPGTCPPGIKDVLVDGVSQGPISSYTFSDVAASHTILATFHPGPFTINATANSGGTISPVGASLVACGSNQTYTIVASGSCPPGIVDVKVDGTSQGPITSYTFTDVRANHTIAATFTSGPFTINQSVGLGGSISPRGAFNVPCGGTSFHYLIYPDNCYRIQDVKVDGVSQGPITTYTFTNVTAAHTLQASFAPLGPFLISSSAGPGGTISPSGGASIACGSNRSYSIAASDNCHSILDVIVDGVSLGPITNYSFTNLRASHTIAATFAEMGPYSIAASAGPGGTISPGGVSGVACAGSGSYTIAPWDDCHRIEDVKVDGVSQGPVSSYSFANVRTAHTIEATFVALAFAIQADAGPGGTITPGGAFNAPCGESRTYTIAPADKCHAIEDVKVDGISQGPVAEYTFPDVRAGHTVEATFSAIGPFLIDASAAAGGSIHPSGAIRVACGGSQSYTIAPAEACRVIDDVQVDGVSVGVPATYTFRDVQGTHTITAASAPSGLKLAETHTGASWGGQTDGAIDLTVSGGVPPYTYAWSSGAKSEDVEHLAAGQYEVEVTDAQGCSSRLGVAIVNVGPAELTLSRPAPNPAPGAMRLRYGIPAAGAVRLSIVDLQGREVAVLAEGTQPAGWSWADWNGQTRNGRAGGGVYFVRLRAGGRQVVQRFALIR